MIRAHGGIQLAKGEYRPTPPSCKWSNSTSPAFANVVISVRSRTELTGTGIEAGTTQSIG